MIFQTKTVVTSADNHKENNSKNLPAMLMTPDEFRNSTDKFDVDLGEYLPCNSNGLLATNFDNKLNSENAYSCTMTTPVPSNLIDELPSSEYSFDESHLLDPFKSPHNEEIVTTSPSDAEGSNTISESTITEYENLTADEIAISLQQACDQIALQATDDSIEQRIMSIENQPPVHLRPRYKSDGTRQIEKSRTKPMTIKLPDLTAAKLDLGQSFLLRLNLITCTENASDTTYIHTNKLEYHSDDVQKLNDETICVPLTLDDITQGKKVLPRLSIVKTKLELYKTEQIPYSLSKCDNKLCENVDKNEKLSIKEAKKIFKQYNIKASRIACQLLIKQNESIHFTNITCQTHIMKEKDQKYPIKKRSRKTMESEDEESEDESFMTLKARSIKRKKHHSKC